MESSPVFPSWNIRVQNQRGRANEKGQRQFGKKQGPTNQMKHVGENTKKESH